MLKTISTRPTIQYETFIPFHYADPAGIMFFAHAFSLAHLAYEHFVLEQLDLKWEEWFQNPKIKIPIKSTEATYIHPLYAGQVCTIHLTLLTIGKHSFSMHYNFNQKHLCCSVKTVHVFWDTGSQQKMRIPDLIDEKLSTWHSLN